MAYATEALVPSPLPPPVGGINARDSLFAMPESDARDIENYVCEGFGLRLKEGTVEYDTVSADSTSSTLGEHHGVDGTTSMFRISSGKIRNVGMSDVDVTGAATITDDIYQWCQFGGKVFLVNGEDPPLDWDGGAVNVNATAWVGSGLTIDNLINVWSYRGRLYFIERDTLNLWYAEDEFLTGTLTKVDYSPVFKRGGSLVAGGEMSISSSNENDVVMALVSSAGEVVVYSGDWPDANNWDRIGHFLVGNPIGYRCLIPVEGDLFVITETALISVLGYLTNERDPVTGQPVSDKSEKINKLWRRYVSLYKGHRSWYGVYNHQRDYILVNIPVTDLGNTFQLCYHRPSKAWSRFTGWSSAAMYYSSSLGGLLFHPRVSSSVVYGDKAGTFGTDPGGSMNHGFVQAFSAMEQGRRPQLKTFRQVEPFMELGIDVDDPPSVTPYEPPLQVGVDTNYKSNAQLGQGTLTFDDETSYFEGLIDVAGEGTVAGLRMSGTITQPVTITYNGANIYWLQGGVK